MSTAEFNMIREDLIQWISSLNDSTLLNLLNSIKLSSLKSRQDWWEELSENQKENIRSGLKDIEDGLTISSEDFWKELRENG